MAVSLGNVLISGANRGLGLEMVRQLIGNEKNRIFAGCRDPTTACELKEVIGSNKNVTIFKLGKIIIDLCCFFIFNCLQNPKTLVTTRILPTL